MTDYLTQHAWLTFWLILAIAAFLDHALTKICYTAYYCVVIICYTLKGRPMQPDLIYSLTDSQLQAVENSLKEHGFDTSKPTGSITSEGVTIVYTIEKLPVPSGEPLNKVSLTIGHHGMLEPKALIIGRLTSMFKSAGIETQGQA